MFLHADLLFIHKNKQNIHSMKKKNYHAETQLQYLNVYLAARNILVIFIVFQKL